MNARWVAVAAAVSTPVFMSWLATESGPVGPVLAVFFAPVAFCVLLACGAIWWCVRKP